MPQIAEVTRKAKDPTFTDEQIDAVLEVLDTTLYPQVVTVDDVPMETQAKARSRAAQMRITLLEDKVKVRATCVATEDGMFLAAVGYHKGDSAPVIAAPVIADASAVDSTPTKSK